MSLVEDQVRQFNEQLCSLTARCAARQLLPPALPWPRERSLVLSHQVAVELGNPSLDGLGALLWTGEVQPCNGVWLLGPDISSLEGAHPLGQVVLVSGRFDDEYGHLLDLQAAIHSVLLKGVTCRSMPDSARFWYRVSYDALHQGVSLAHVGNAIVASLMDLEGIEGVTVLLITSDEQLAPLKGLSTQANRIAASLIKRNEETEHECDACDFSDICLEGAS